MRNYLFSFGLLLSFLLTEIICLGQSSPKNEPEVKIDVKKEVDENGNITRYDSTYSYEYNIQGGDSADLKFPFFDNFGNNFGFSDSSLMSEMYKDMLKSFQGMELEKNFNDLFNEDGFFNDLDKMFDSQLKNFFNEDYFDEFDKKFRQGFEGFTDSLKNYKDSFLFPDPPKIKEKKSKKEEKGVRI